MPLVGNDWLRLPTDLLKAAQMQRAFEEHGTLRGVAVRGVEIAQAKFGTYQDGWPELSEGTQEERARLGFTPDDPLLRTGGLRDSVRIIEDTGSEVSFGIPEADEHYEIAMTQEFGSISGNVPPRPMWPAVVEELEPILVEASTVTIKEALGG